MHTTGDIEGNDNAPEHGSHARAMVVASQPAAADDDTKPPARRPWRTVAMGACAAVLVSALAAVAVSFEPDTFDVTANVESLTGRTAGETAPGTHTATALVGVIDRMLNKAGGFMMNDVMPPFALLDNLPSWERGALTEVRDTVRALRNDLARQQTQSREDPDLARADAQLHFDATNWILPDTEGEFRKGRDALLRYVQRLQVSGPERAVFEVRADNLNFYLATVEKRLGSYAQRLAGSVGDWRMPGWLGGTNEPRDPDEVPWLEVDDVFFEARGYTWALLHTLRGVERDFGPMLEAKAAVRPLANIIEKLEQTQAAVWSPVIMNNSGFGLLTNHSLVMTSYISRANAAIIEFRLLLSEG